MSAITVTIEWQRIHAAAMAIDSIRGNLGCVGFVDVFGGRYSPERYESQGLPGLVRLVEVSRLLREQVWRTVQNGARSIAAAGGWKPGDGWLWMSAVPVSAVSKRVMRTRYHATHKAAKRRARRWGGNVRAIQNPKKGEARRRKELFRVRDAVQVALWIKPLFEAFEQSGVVDSSHRSEICGQVSDSIWLSGLNYLRGFTYDGSLTPLSEIQGFIEDPEKFVKP